MSAVDEVGGGISGGRSALVVLGMHRSGTSFLSHAISVLGFAQPADLMLPQIDNPAGFWEPLSVVRLNDEILTSLGGAWNRPGPWYAPGRSLADSRGPIAAHLIDRWADRAVQALQRSYGETPRLVLKDPRISLFVPLWREALRRIGAEPRFVLSCRSPLDVAASLRAREQMPVRLAYNLWQAYTLGALSAGPAISTVFYDALLADPAAALAPMLADVGLSSLLTAEAEERLRAIAMPSLRHHSAEASKIDAAPLLAQQVKDTWRLLEGRPGLADDERRARVADLQQRYDEAQMLAGGGQILDITVPAAVLTPVEPAPIPASPGAEAPATGQPRRVLLHYHLFKNAGSSVDAMLKRNFGARWAEEEFAAEPGRSNVAAVEAYLAGKPDLIALSSHTALLPVPQVPGVEIFPIMFFRHPLLRLKSAYSFERTQQADTFGARLARSSSFSHYVEQLLKIEGNRQARNFQAFRLAFGDDASSGSLLDRAMRSLARLPFAGLVEAYDESLDRLQALLAPCFPGFEAVSVHENATASSKTLSIGERVDRLRDEVGADLFARLEAANADDMILFQAVSARYGVSHD